MRRALALTGLAALALAGCGDVRQRPPSTTPPVPDAPAAVRAEEVAAGLRAPVQVMRPDPAGPLWVVEQPGRIVALDGPRQEVVLDLQDRVGSGGERGLLGVAARPGDRAARRLFVHFTDRSGDTRVQEVERGPGGRARVLRTLLAVDQPYANHNGGALLFGPDGRLYLGLGDGGDAWDPAERSQDPGTPLGKVLRIDVDRPGAEWGIVALGARNPWRMSFDPAGTLWIADVGQDRWEEVNAVRVPARGRLNLGWDAYEGREPMEPTPLGGGRLVAPVHVYGHDRGCSVTGGEVVRPGGPPSLVGRYLFADFCSGTLWSLRLRGGRAEVRREAAPLPGVTSIQQVPGGAVLVTLAGGRLLRLAEPAPGG